MGISDLCERLAKLDAAIIQQQQVLDKLETDRRSVQLQLQSVVYPVLTLPHEITSEIFMCCLPAANELASTVTLRAPLLLLRVCRAWNSVAKSTPALWASLSLDLSTRLLLEEEERVEGLVQNWFDLAGSCPLTLFFSGSEEGGYSANTVVSRYAPQLYHLELFLEEDEFLGLRDIGPFPLLQVLTISLPYTDNAKEVDSLHPGLFYDTPVLRQLTLADDVIPSFITLSWHRLTRFIGGRFVVEDCLVVLRLAPLLVDCTFCVWPATNIPVQDLLTHVSLKYLSLVEAPYGRSANLFKHITLPSLQTLHLTGYSHIDDDDSFKSFIARSSPPLRSFSLRGNYRGNDIAPEPLNNLPMVTDLELWDIEGWFGANFLRLLADGGKDFMPQLQSITFPDCTFPSLGYENLVQALCSRWHPQREGVADLRSFKIVWPKMIRPFYDKATLHPLSELVARGASIYIGSADHNYF